jgi:signal transduction histidine kinase/DNA-binding response OmpR family regulator
VPHRSDRPLSKASPPERRSERFTLRRRLTVSLMTVGLASLCLASLVYVAVDTWSYRSALQDRMALLAERAAWRWQLQVRDPAIDGSWAQGLSEDPSVHAAYLFDPEGHTLAAIAPPREAERGAERESWLGPRVQREVFRDGRLLGTVVVQASGAALGVRLLNQAGMFLALAGVSALLTLALSRRIHHRFSDQLLDLAHAANAISTRKDYSIRAVRRSEDEIGMLVDTFNHMITQIEMRDQQLKAEVKRAESARVAKSAFLATMSHEIRTPINGILGMTELLRDTKLSSEQADFARTIHESATGLLSVINDILDFSKGEAGRYEIERVPFELAKVVHECLDTVSIVAAEKELELCLELDERVPARVHGDPSRLRQVLLNLLSNALKFTPRGEIVLRIQLEDLQAKSARVRFEVQDTGIGIPQDRIDRLFQSFSQVDASRSRKYGGTGLGLAISKQIVEAMGGSMFVKTEAGVGSTFGFKLQLPVETGAPEREQNALPHAVRVLIVDPSPTSGAVLARMLKEDNLIELVADGAGARLKLIEAVSAARPFDLILADLRLIDALGSLEVIGAQQAATAPLVVLAPVNQLAAAAAVSWAGRRAALAKPVKRSDLIWCVGEVLRGPLPSQSAPERRPEDPRPAGGQGERGLRLPEGRKVLVAEDHPVNQRITTRFLDKLGVAWELVANGEEALEAVKKRSFDLILMDVQMPVMDGLEATLAIRKLETMSGTHVPIVALTANVLEEHRREAQQAGFDDYLAKPVKLEDLRARILKWLPERALASAA